MSLCHKANVQLKPRHHHSYEVSYTESTVMNYLARSTILFIIAAAGPMVFLFLELVPSDSFAPDWFSYAFLVISLAALGFALFETFVGYEEADEEELKEMSDIGG